MRSHVIDASLFAAMTFSSIIMGNPIRGPASRSLCLMQSQITCLKMVIECDLDDPSLTCLYLSQPLHSLPATPLTKCMDFTWYRDERQPLNVNDLKWLWVHRSTRGHWQRKVKSEFDSASILSADAWRPPQTPFACLAVCRYKQFKLKIQGSGLRWSIKCTSPSRPLTRHSIYIHFLSAWGLAG
jgi:hypothetical protein